MKVPDGEVLDIKLEAEDGRKPGIDEGSGMFLSSVSVEVNWVGNLEGVGPRDGEPLGNSEGTRDSNKKSYLMLKCWVGHL